MGPILPIYCSRSEQLLVDVTAIRLADLGYHHCIAVEFVRSRSHSTAAADDSLPELPKASSSEPLAVIRGSGSDVKDKPWGHATLAWRHNTRRLWPCARWLGLSLVISLLRRVGGIVSLLTLLYLLQYLGMVSLLENLAHGFRGHVIVVETHPLDKQAPSVLTKAFCAYDTVDLVLSVC